MRCSRLIPLLAAATVASAAPLLAQSFEGTIWFVTNNADGTRQDTIVQITRPGMLRMEMRNGREAEGGGFMLVDSKANTITMVMAQQKMYMTRPIPQLDTIAAKDMGDMTVTETGRTETVAGVSCRVYEGQRTTKEGVKKGEGCFAKGVGFQIADAMWNMSHRSAQGSNFYQVWKKLKDQDLHLLKLTEITDGKPRVTIMAVKIERSAPPASMFQPPAGYTQMQMPGMKMP